MLDFIRWRGDLSFGVSPPGEIDALIFSQLSYLHFRDALGDGAAPLRAAARLVEAQEREPGNAQVVSQRHELLHAAARSVRYGRLTVSRCEDIFDADREMQFAAVSFDLPDGSRMVAFRGTDATLVGWRENFAMSFACPVPSQSEAVRYLNAAAEGTAGVLRLCGHSKGGNLAIYAVACCEKAVRARVAEVYLFDAPGLDAATLARDGYRDALGRVRCYVPQTSLIGRLMGVPEQYTVVRSTALGIAQHNVFTWALDGPRFQTLPTLDHASRLMKATVDDFMTDSAPESRRLFVETLFSVLGSANATTFGEMAERWTDTAGALWNAMRTLDPATRKAVLNIAGNMAASGVESARRLIGLYRDDAEHGDLPAGKSQPALATPAPQDGPAAHAEPRPAAAPALPDEPTASV
ncbi:MAG: DUF2974 domain-containing protein [Clostridiales bacterium]|nr:DUF2974 domain-containing protein [Clostridiales bacterium]